MSKNRGVLGAVAAVVVVLLVAVVVFLNRSPESRAPIAQSSSSAPAGAPAASGKVTPAAPATPTLPSAATVGAADPFGALSCKARQYADSLSLAVTFTQPVDRKAELTRFIEVIDTGPLKGGDADAKAKVQAAAGADTGKTVQGSWTVGDNPRMIYFPYVVPQHRYVIRLRADLPGEGGKVTLGSPSHCDVETEAMPPSFYFASKGVVLPAGQNGGLPVTTVNMPEVDVQFLRVAPERVPEFFDAVVGNRGSARDDDDDGRDYDDYYGNRSLKGLVSSWDLERLTTLSTSVYQGRFLTDDKANRSHVTFLPVEGIKELQEPGIYIAVMSQPGHFREEYQTTYFYVSDIGLHARRYANRIEAYTVSLKQGQAISGDTVELIDANGKTLAKAAADAQGHVRFDGSFDKARVIRASRGKEMTVLSLGDPALDLSEFDIQGLPSVDNNLFVYSGRDLYRPGETFNVSVLPRDADGRPLSGAPLTATIKRPDGRTVQTALWSPDKDQDKPRYVQHAIELPPDAQTGTWMLELRVDPAARRADATWAFKVEEFLPERMKLALQADDGPLAPGDALDIDVQGDYLYGAPAAGNRLLSSFTVKRDRYAQQQKWPGFIFGDVNDDSIKHYEELPESQLDDQGKGSIEVDTTNYKDASSPLKVRVSASLLESGGRPVVRSIERSIWPAEKLVAVRPLFDSDVTREGAPANFEVIRVDGKGELAPLEHAQVRLYKEERRYYWRYDDQRGWNSGYTDTEELVDSRVVALQARLPMSLPVNYGRYRLEINDPETSQTLKYRFYAGWGAQDDEAAGNRPDRVQMKLENVPAKPGDKVKLTLTPPHDGQALVTVEGDRMLWSTWVTAKATGTEVEIPVDPSWKRHDLYVGAVVFRPGSAGDRVTPARAVGLAYLPLQAEGRKLDVHLTAPAKVQPETRTTVKIKVDGAANKKATVTLSAVDVGILNIDQFQTPDPFNFFFGKHRYAPDLLDMYGKLIEKMDGTQGRLKWGGDAAMRGDTKTLPKKVKLVDLFSGPVTLNDKGEAEIPLDLPDFNGTLRLMAVAFTNEQYGSADAEMVVAAPIVAELSTPRFITPGDEAAIALDVTNLSGATQKVTVKLEANDPLAITDGVRTVTLKDKQRTTVRFNATTSGSYGLGLMRLTVDGQGGDKPVHIVRESVLQVQPAQAAERQVRRLRLMPGETSATQADWVAKYFPDSTTVSLTMSTEPPFNVARLVHDLLSYPYGCTEQTVSATLPWLLMDADTAKRYDVDKFSPALRQDKVNGALARLSGMRSSNGSYSLWGGDAGSRDIWLTAYATGFMQDARDRGFSVPEATIDRSRNWLLQQVQQTGSSFGSWSANLKRGVESGRVGTNELSVLREDHRRFAGLAAASLVLARDGKAPLSTVRQLYDTYQERARSPLPLVQLAAAFKLMGDEGRMKAALDQAMTRQYGMAFISGSSAYVDEWMGDYGSPVRDLALSYALMAQYDLRHERRETLLTDLAARLGGRSYFSTQEQMALLLAARTAGGKQNAPWEMTLANGTVRKVVQATGDRSVSLRAGDMGGLQLVNTGSQPVFAELDIQGSSINPPAPRADVIRVQRRWYRPDGTPWDGGVLQTGDILVAWIRADATRRIPDGLVVDRVPAGLEVENLNLTQNPDMNDWTIGNRRVADALSNPNIKHTEFRDDRYVAAVSLGSGAVDIFYLLRVVTPGKFAVPSTVAEDMYRPELRGVGDQWSKIEVRDRSAARTR
ncbi:alpha-2-macroglobulin family protein [Achromobacter aloeverae]|uniref:alpha-2-macroglobulin family protein n=1 Tax=Achromobacter aloeverae TaxID=1750518 RepID=UPI001F01A720|nr:alpha-2-macroglobulin [Achromobacter aloeverae]